MPALPDGHLLDALLDSWDRNNTILINLLGALPPDALQTRVIADSPSVAQLFTHIHYVRLVFLAEDAPEFSRDVPTEEWASEHDPDRIARMLRDSAGAIREAVKGKIETGTAMQIHYDHPILLLQHMIWHEGYHHGQIKLVAQAVGPSPYQSASWTAHLARVDAQEQRHLAVVSNGIETRAQRLAPINPLLWIGIDRGEHLVPLHVNQHPASDPGCIAVENNP